MARVAVRHTVKHTVRHMVRHMMVYADMRTKRLVVVRCKRRLLNCGAGLGFPGCLAVDIASDLSPATLNQLLPGMASRKCVRALDIHGCDKIQDKAVKDLAMQSPFLTWFNASGCVQVTDDTLQCLLDNCPQLAWLNVSGCWKISQANDRIDVICQPCL